MGWSLLWEPAEGVWLTVEVELSGGGAISRECGALLADSWGRGLGCRGVASPSRGGATGLHLALSHPVLLPAKGRGGARRFSAGGRV